MNATMNTFPPFQSMNSPRGWILAVIVVLHVGFFYFLSSGLIPNLLPPKSHHSDVIFIPPAQTDPEPPRPTKIEPTDVKPVIEVPRLPPIVDPEDATPVAPEARTLPPIVPTIENPTATGSGPVVLEPQIDPRHALSEPLYPSRAIRENRGGTLIISVYVLADGRIGEVRLDRSSGHTDLDNSALREARKWRLKPGMRDGIAVPMWKQIPITFQVKDVGPRF